MAIAFKQEEFGEALKDFIGQIVDTEYSLTPFGFKGAPEIKRAGKVLAIMIRTGTYEKEQFEWYPPSRVKKTKTGKLVLGYRAWSEDWQVYTLFRIGRPISESKFPVVKWAYLIEALNAVGAMKDVSVAGATDDERMTGFGKSLLGMKFRWQEKEFESLVKEKGGAQKTFNLIVPIEYLGKAPIEAKVEVKQATIGEAVGEPAPEV